MGGGEELGAGEVAHPPLEVGAGARQLDAVDEGGGDVMAQQVHVHQSHLCGDCADTSKCIVATIPSCLIH